MHLLPFEGKRASVGGQRDMFSSETGEDYRWWASDGDYNTKGTVRHEESTYEYHSYFDKAAEVFI
jgi:hypothetical protein